MTSSAAKLQRQYREQIKAQTQRTEQQNLRTLRWAISAVEKDPKAVEDIVRKYERRLRKQPDETI